MDQIFLVIAAWLAKKLGLRAGEIFELLGEQEKPNVVEHVDGSVIETGEEWEWEEEGKKRVGFKWNS